MNIRFLMFFLSFCFLFDPAQVAGCTSVIITGKHTPDGRPLLLKHRDAAGELERLVNFRGEKYNITAIIAGSDSLGLVCGTNSARLSIVNTATFNLGSRKIAGISPSRVMYEALSGCQTIEEFETLLTTLQAKDSLVPANFGLIDYVGGAAYYEVAYDKWTKFDVNDPEVAPDGYMVYTNFSKTGDTRNRRGYVRFLTADNILQEAIREKKTKFTPMWLINHISRSLRNDYAGIDLTKDYTLSVNGLFPDMDFIPNRYTKSVTIFQGSRNCDEETTMWMVPGNPLFTPVFVYTAKKGVPLNLYTDIARESKCLLNRFYINSYDKEKYYLKYIELYHEGGVGLTQEIRREEESLLVMDGYIDFVLDRYKEIIKDYQ